MQKLKSIFAFFTLAVFLFPLVESELHTFSHSNDFHCTASEKHFHPAEHHCDLCDFIFDVTESHALNNHNLTAHEWCVVNFFFLENNTTLQDKAFRPLRAPPVLV